jgi:HlyD family secretion protein
MDIQRPPEVARARKIKRGIYAGSAVLLLAGVTFGVSRLKPAAPSVDRSTVWTGEVKRGEMVREVRGLGTLVPIEIDWLPAQTDGRIIKRLLLPGAPVKPDTVILVLSNPEVEQEMLDAEAQLKAAEADYENLKVQVNSDLLNQRSLTATVRSDYEQAKIQHHVDKQLVSEGLEAKVKEELSAVQEEQLGLRLKLEEDRTKNAEDSEKARLAAGESKVEQQRALYQLRKSQYDALTVRAGINGVLESVPVDVGQSVTPGTNLARVADPKRLKAEIKIAETQAKDVAPGQKASIDTRNGIVPGHVERIDPSVVNGTVTVDVYMDGPLPSGARPDLSVDGTITIEKLNDVLYVGRPVHGESDSTISLFKLVDGGSDAERVTVQLGRTSVNTVEVLQGLQVGDQVILSDMSAWDNYDRIRLK